jgi:hypothetical protein
MALSVVLSRAETHVEEVEHCPPNVTARSVAATTDIDVIGTPFRAHEDLYRANPSRITSAE